MLTSLEAPLEHEIVLVDDGSSDGTLSMLNELARRDPCVKVYSLSRNFGHQVALSAGLDVADGDAVVMMDSDMQHPPSLLPELIAQWREGYDVVSAVRQRTEDAGLWKHLSSRGFYCLLNRLSDVHIVEGAADFCLLSRRAHTALLQMPERHRFLRGLISWMGFKRGFVPYVAAERGGGQSKYTWRKMFALAIDAAISFSATPMRLAVHCGFITAALGMLYGIYIFGRALMGAEDFVPGWASVMCVVLFLGGVQLAFIGIIGEYIGHIFEQVKGRPLYLFKQTPELPDQRDVPQAVTQLKPVSHQV